MEITGFELALLLWAVVASATASHYFGRVARLKQLLIGAQVFTTQLLHSREMYDGLREALLGEKDDV